MKIKERTESKELMIYRAVHFRKSLNREEEKHFFNIEKGFLGEQHFDEWLQPVLNDKILLPDMQFMKNSNFSQIDTILLTSQLNYIFEVKNYEGDFILEGDSLNRTDGIDVKNPLLQMKRNEPLVRNVLQNLGNNTPIVSIAVFVNPQFHLYNAPQNLPIIYPAQLPRFIEKINQKPSHLNKTQIDLAKKLVSRTLAENPYERLPLYKYEELKKGIVCPYCGWFYRSYSRMLKCESCNRKEDSLAAVLRSLEEFRLLFPERRLSLSQAFDWCGIIKDKKTVRKILNTEFNLTPIGRGSYYTKK
ncbi:nuclease-related domain-containing protein [Bacillus sp. P14.5]|uniref:nuclease-related domain-containing protein n=1 Tax=Bacillus sp. P14.5 TaxID=1983400 RepID=UPI001F05486B|nr:nuclease-related domain-containing protein [Bacillus sp. P14.5]